MAEGLFKTTGQVAVVLGNPGPGTSNLIPGLVTARHEGVPVIAITSQHRAGIVYPATPATFQGQDQLDLLKPAVKWNAPVFEWTRIPELVRMAFREMFAGRPGPVHLEIPGPVLYAEGDPATAPVFTHESGRAGPPQASDAQLEAAAQLLASAKTPVIFAGTGVDRAWANVALIALAEQLGCPVIPSLAGRSVMPHDHPLCFLSQSPSADELRRKADVMLVVGSRVGNLDVPFDKYWGDPSGCRIVQVDVDPRHIGVSRPVALGIVADARTTLEGLARQAARPPDREPGPHRRAGAAGRRTAPGCRHIRERVAAWNGPGIHPAHACAVVGEVFGRDAIYTRRRRQHVAVGVARPAVHAAVLVPQHPRVRACSARAFPRRSAPSSAHPTARSSASRATAPRASTSWSCRALPATASRSPWSSWPRASGPWRSRTRCSATARRSARPWARCAGTSWRRGSAAMASSCSRSRNCRRHSSAPAHDDRPALVCVRTSKEANLSIPDDVVARFFEVYFGPAA